MMILGVVLFFVISVLIAPQSRAFLAAQVVGASAFMSAWAPFSYVLVLLLMGALLAGIYVIQSWPKSVELENPMAKYRREAAVKDD